MQTAVITWRSRGALELLAAQVDMPRTAWLRYETQEIAVEGVSELAWSDEQIQVLKPEDPWHVKRIVMRQGLRDNCARETGYICETPVERLNGG